MNDTQDPREGGAWIGQHPDENTERGREALDDGAERVAVTQNESGEAPRGDGGRAATGRVTRPVTTTSVRPARTADDRSAGEGTDERQA